MTGTTEIKEWINSTLGGGINQEESLAQTLKSGIVLCNLMNKIQPGLIKTINPNNGSLAYKENIGSFLRSCQSLGLDECRLFDISDLYDERNINQVVTTLSMLQSFSVRSNSASDLNVNFISSSPPIQQLRRVQSGRSTSDPAFVEVLGEPEPQEGAKKEKKKNAKATLERIFLRKSTSIPKISLPSPPSSPKTHLRESSPPASASYALSRVYSSESVASEVARLREDLEKLHEDRKILKERVGFSYPEKYRSSAVFEDFIKKENELGFTPPNGMSEIDYLKGEEARMLSDIFTLTSMLAIVEENRGLRIRMAELQKMVDAMVAEKKQAASRVDELLVPAANEPAVETDGLMLSEWKGKTGEIKGGTAEKLVERLYTTSIAGSVSEYVDFFLLTYRSFITPKKVLEILTQTFLANRAETSEPSTEDTETTAIQQQQDKLMRLRICNFLKRWVESYYEDFDADLMVAFQGFIDACQEDKLVVLLKKTLEKKLGGGIQAQRLFTFDSSPPTPILPRVSSSSLSSSTSSFSHDDWDPIEIARQLTIIEYEMYREITPKELLSLSWQKNDREKRSPNLLKMIHRFNEVNNWVQWQIVSEPNIKKRAAAIKKMIRVTEELKKLNNFNAVFVFVSALHSASINRLRKTWEEVGKSQMKQLEEFDMLTSPNGSFMLYREELHNANPPCIPYVGVYLSDLTFIEEGNPDCLENGYINFFKRRMIAEVIKEIQQYQQTPYNLQPVPTLQKFITSHKVLSDNDLFQRSLVSEPRDTHSMSVH